MADSADLDNRFAYHAAHTDDRRAAHEWVRHHCRELAAHLDSLVPEGREKALVFTNLEQVMFWANAAIARQPEEG